MEKAEQYYDKIASIYDTSTAKAWNAPGQVENISMSLSNKNTDVLDIGIGTGQSIQKIFLSQQFKSIEGIDTSSKMLAICAEKFPGIHLHHGEFLSYSNFKLNNYGLIVCCGTLEFITDLNQFFSKCKNLLASNGNIVLSYEPKVFEHKVQSQSISEVSSERVNKVNGFMTYRYDIDEFNTLAEKNDFKIIKNQLFVSYNKLGSDIIYSLVHLSLK